MSYKNLFVLLCLLMFAKPAVAEVEDTTQLQCLAANILLRSEEPEDRERIGWVTHNRVQSDEFSGSYCEEADNNSDWLVKANAAGIVRSLSSAKRGSDEHKRAQDALKSYQESLKNYYSAQIIAYRILGGKESDITDGATTYEVPAEEAASDPS